MVSHIHSLPTPIDPPFSFSSLRRTEAGFIKNHHREVEKSSERDIPQSGQGSQGRKKVPTHFCVESLKRGNVSQAVPVKNRNLSQSCREAVSPKSKNQKKKKRIRVLKTNALCRTEPRCTHVPLQPPAELLRGVWGQLCGTDCRLPLSGASPQARGAGKGDDRSRQFQNADLGSTFPWQNTGAF